MQIYALRCVSGNDDDPKIHWKKNDWVGNHMGNPVDELSDATFFVIKPDVVRRKELLEMLGCEFKLVTFALVETPQ